MIPQKPFAEKLLRTEEARWQAIVFFLVPHLVEKERPCRIVTEIQLPTIDYENFITDMLADHQFLSDQGRRCKKGEVWDCLLVRRKGQPDGVLVMPEAERFVGRAAHDSDR